MARQIIRGLLPSGSGGRALSRRNPYARQRSPVDEVIDAESTVNPPTSTELGFLRGSDRLPTRPPSAAGAKDILGKVPIGLGKKLLYGAGVVGNVLLVLDLLMAGMDEAGRSSRSRDLLRSGQTNRTQAALANLLSGEGRDLARSQNLRRLSNIREPEPSISPELQEIIRDADMRELIKARHQPKPSVKEAYARAGLL